MGEMADYYYELAQAQEMDAELYGYDECPEDFYPNSDYAVIRTVRCAYCKTGGLRWKSTPTGWRLFRGDKMHSCNVTYSLKGTKFNLKKESKL